MQKITVNESKLVDIIEELSNIEVGRKKATWLAEEKAKWVKETQFNLDKKLVDKITILENKLSNKTIINK